MREFSALGIGDALTAAGIENRESCFYNRFGQFIHREHPPDFINIKVEEPVGDKPFDDLDKFISQDELRALSQNYKRIAGFALTDGGLGRGRKAGGGRRLA